MPRHFFSFQSCFEFGGRKTNVTMEQQDQAIADSCLNLNPVNDINIDIDTALYKILVPRLSQENCKCAEVWKAFEASEAHEHFKAYDAFVATEEEARKAEGIESSDEESWEDEASEVSDEEPFDDEASNGEASEDPDNNIIIEGFHPRYYSKVINETGAQEIMANSLKALRKSPTQPPDALQFIQEHFFVKFNPKMEEYWDKRAARTRMALEKEAQLLKTRLVELVKMKEEKAKLKGQLADLLAQSDMLKAHLEARALEAQSLKAHLEARALEAQSLKAEVTVLKLE